MNDVTYSPCPTCEEKQRLPWRLRAKKITYHGDQNKMTYRHAYLDVYNVPVFYTPYFKHPVGEQNGQSGVLPPRFGRSSSRGEETTLSYYQYFNPNQDATFRTRLMSQRGVQLQAEHRYIGQNLSSEIRGSVLPDSRTSSTRSNLEASGEYVPEVATRIGFNGNLSSDDTYLDDLFGKTDSYLSSTAYVEKATADTYMAGYSTWYQHLEAGKDPATTAQVLPRFRYEKLVDLDGDNAVKLSADVQSLYRDKGTKTQRIATSAGYIKPYRTNDGQNIELSANLRADGYHVDGANTRDGFTGRIVPEVAAKWEKPFISGGGHHTITPKLMAIASPRGGNSSNIPNEDSVAYELDTNNLFATNRFAGYDRVESGPRIIYGLDNTWGNAQESRYRLFLGQSYRMFDDAALPTLGGTKTKFSDWVGRVELAPVRWFAFNNRFRLDNATFDPRRLDTSFLLGYIDQSYLQFTHTLLDGGAEEATLKGQYEINNNWDFTTELRKDMTDDGKLLLSEGQLIYTHDCYRTSFVIRRRGYDNRNVRPSTDYLFNIELLSLGRDYD